MTWYSSLGAKGRSHSEFNLFVWETTQVPDDEHCECIQRFELKNGDLVCVEALDLFDRQFAKLGLDELDRNVLELTILAGNAPSVVVPGTNGIRKMRFAPPRSKIGKRGAYRVFYLPVPECKILFLMGILSKSENDDFSKEQRNALAKMVVRLVAYAKRRDDER